MSWYQKNKKWFLPTVIITPILLLGVFIFTILLIITSFMKNSDLYEDSVAKCMANQEIVSYLGKPVESGFFVSGNISITNGSGSGNINYSLEGPNGEVQVHAVGRGIFGIWTINTLNVYLPGTEKIIDLTEE